MDRAGKIALLGLGGLGLVLLAKDTQARVAQSIDLFPGLPPPTPTPAPAPSSRTPAPAPSGGQAVTPAAYATRKLSTLQQRWESSLGDYVRRYMPEIWGDVPPEAAVGFTSIATSATEDTGDVSLGARRNRSFHEIGYFQTPAGPSSGPAPGSSSSYANLGRSETFRALVGRGADLAEGAWKTAIEDQTVIGLLDLKNNFEDLARRVLEAQAFDLHELSPQGQWFAACDAFSAGAAGASRVIAPAVDAYKRNTFAARVGGAPIGLWIREVLGKWDMEEWRLFPVGGNPHRNIAYSTLRCWQKWESGKLLAQQTGGNAAWFDLGLVASDVSRMQTALVTAARGHA